MTTEVVRQRLSPYEASLRQLRVKRLSIFGSTARGEAGASSDLDFLVEFEGPATFDGYMSLKELLEREFNARIDLVTRRALKPQIRDLVLDEAVQVA